ncbi:hypothetical protein C5167_030482 [Papaver somniferum]|nr:hypothetical protein C5167_030482 [Papaver somniferum]
MMIESGFRSDFGSIKTKGLFGFYPKTGVVVHYPGYALSVVLINTLRETERILKETGRSVSISNFPLEMSNCTAAFKAQ